MSYKPKFENNNNYMPKSIKILLGVLLGVLSLITIAVIGVIIWGFINFSPSQFHGTWISPPKLAADFSLQSDSGMVHLADFNGKLVMLYFG